MTDHKLKGTKYAWYHDGYNKNGTVELTYNSKIRWCDGHK